VRVVQNARKKAGLNVDDRIALSLKTDDAELNKAIKEHSDTIQAETLTKAYDEAGEFGYSDTVKVDGVELHLSLEKVA
jgi:isoleucyl-tRNA synthetase